MPHEYSFEELKHSSVAHLREIAEGIENEAVQGYTQMNKDHLLQAICTALGIEMHAHHEVVGIDKATVKRRIKALREQRDAALEAHDAVLLKRARRRLHRLKRRLHGATV